MSHRWIALVGLAAVLMLGAPHSALAAVEPPAQSPICGDPLSFESSDGVKLYGHLFKADGAVKGSILFIHEPFRSQRDWSYLAEKMSRRGYTSLIFDLRGHGQSLMKGDEELDREVFMEEDFWAMTLDVQAAIDTLRKHVKTDVLHLMGADLGGSLALLHANNDPAVTTVAMISPGLGYDDVNIVGQAEKFDRPLLLVYSVEDSYSRKSAEVLGGKARGPAHTEVYYGVGHGTKMMSREPAVEQFLQAWFLGTVITLEGRELADTGKPGSVDREVEGGVDAEAEKRKLQEQRDAIEEGAVKEDEDDERKKLGDALDRGSRG